MSHRSETVESKDVTPKTSDGKERQVKEVGFPYIKSSLSNSRLEKSRRKECFFFFFFFRRGITKNKTVIK